MKLHLLSITAIMIACSSNKSSIDNEQKINSDTIVINNKVFNLDSISEMDYKHENKPKILEQRTEFIDDTTNVSRDSLRLTFHLKNGSDSILTNDTSDNGDKHIRFTYLESCPNIDYWLIKITYYEGGEYMLLDKENGNKMYLWSKPIFSPDKKHFITNSCDLEAGYDANGFQLFEVKNKNIKECWSKAITDWGPSEIFWKNDSTLFIEQTRFGHDYSNKISNKEMIIK
jgi:hypothetical protein